MTASRRRDNDATQHASRVPEPVRAGQDDWPAQQLAAEQAVEGLALEHVAAEHLDGSSPVALGHQFLAPVERVQVDHHRRGDPAVRQRPVQRPICPRAQSDEDEPIREIHLAELIDQPQRVIGHLLGVEVAGPGQPLVVAIGVADRVEIDTHARNPARRPPATELDPGPARARPAQGTRVEQHGGQITITSESGQGTYVQIQLPLRE